MEMIDFGQLINYCLVQKNQTIIYNQLILKYFHSMDRRMVHLPYFLSFWGANLLSRQVAAQWHVLWDVSKDLPVRLFGEIWDSPPRDCASESIFHYICE